MGKVPLDSESLAMKPLRIGTRGSRLALAQTRLAAEALKGVMPDRNVCIVPVRTSGDRTAGPLVDAGGKGLFTAELEEALRRGELDLAVHSAKDMPAVLADDLSIAAVLPRGDARDVLVSRSGPLEVLPARARVGTSSLRRAALLREARADLDIAPIRGNVDTRLQKVLGRDALFDAVVFALVGLERSELLPSCADHVFPLDIERFIPAAGQGALVLQTRSDNTDLRRLLAAVDDENARQALLAERSVVAGLQADCHSCLAVYITPNSVGWTARAMVAEPDGSNLLRCAADAPSARQAAEMLLRDLVKRIPREHAG
jgi:hydroxymethylbilane synthase